MPDVSKYVPEYVSIRRMLSYGLFLLCFFAAWLKGGVYGGFSWPLVATTLLLVAGIWLIRPGPRDAIRTRIREDPLFKPGIVFGVLLLLQAINSNRWVDVVPSGELVFRRPPPAWFPWSVHFSESFEMVVLFIPAWIAALCVRNILERRHSSRLVKMLAINAGLVALVGILQAVSGAGNALRENDFAVFDYRNHACAWLYLNAFLAAGLAHESHVQHRPLIQTVVWSCVLLVCLVATFLTLSRYGAFVCLGLAGAALAIFLRNMRGKASGFAAVNIYIFSGILGLFCLALFFGAGNGALAEEVLGKSVVGEHSISDDLLGRFKNMPPALKLARDYPLFGAGGHGYQWLARAYMPLEEWQEWREAAKSYVHCDPVQFLSEFGLVGVFCIVLAAVTLFKPVFSMPNPPVLTVWISFGIGFVWLQSFIDYPFRSPAILYQWVLLLAVVPRIGPCEKEVAEAVEA